MEEGDEVRAEAGTRDEAETEEEAEEIETDRATEDAADPTSGAKLRLQATIEGGGKDENNNKQERGASPQTRRIPLRSIDPDGIGSTTHHWRDDSRGVREQVHQNGLPHPLHPAQPNAKSQSSPWARTQFLRAETEERYERGGDDDEDAQRRPTHVLTNNFSW